MYALRTSGRTANNYGSGMAFTSVEQTNSALASTGYLVDTNLAMSVFLAQTLGKPILLEGPAGTGKTELAKAVAEISGAELVRLQCYEGLDEARALYEWNYRKQLLRIQSTQTTGGADSTSAEWSELHDDIFSEEFLLERPLLRAIRSERPVVLLIDEIDKADVEVEGLLLEVLSDFQVTIPELGTVTAATHPYVVLTSNATRELSEALKRRCLYSHVGYPEQEREIAIVLARVPTFNSDLAKSIVRAINAMRDLDLRKRPSVAETIDWAQALQSLGVTELSEETIDLTLGVVLKHVSDQHKVSDMLGLGKKT